MGPQRVPSALAASLNLVDMTQMDGSLRIFRELFLFLGER